MKQTNIRSEVVRGRTELRVYPQEKLLTFVHPSQGPHDYRTVGKGILSRNLTIPSGEQTAYLVQGAYGSEEPEFREIQETMQSRFLWVFNRNLWTTKGVYVVHDNLAVGLTQELKSSELEEKLDKGSEQEGVRLSKDGNIRFASRSTYRLGEHTPESLAKDGFVIASYGVSGAEALGEVASRFRNKPFVYGLEIREEQNSVQRVSALDSNWSDVHWLGVVGDLRGNDRGGGAFGG